MGRRHRNRSCTDTATGPAWRQAFGRLFGASPCHLEHALSEIEWFATIVDSPSNAALVAEGQLLGHLRLLDSAPNASVLETSHLAQRPRLAFFEPRLSAANVAPWREVTTVRRLTTRPERSDTPGAHGRRLARRGPHSAPSPGCGMPSQNTTMTSGGVALSASLVAPTCRVNMPTRVSLQLSFTVSFAARHGRRRTRRAHDCY